MDEMNVETFFTPSDLEAIKRAVHAAEGRTAGEIVPYVVAASDDYPEAGWRGATLGALVAAAAAALVHELAGLWGGWFAAWVVAPPLLGAVAGLIAASYVPAVRRRLIHDATVDLNVRRRADQAFLHEEVFRTRDRTGILVFLSLLERRVVVLADKGIAAAVEQREWDSIVAGIVSGIRAGRPAAALIDGIGACGALLEQRGVTIKPDDRDELSDALRTEKR
jgi:putative membrane protein